MHQHRESEIINSYTLDGLYTGHLHVIKCFIFLLLVGYNKTIRQFKFDYDMILDYVPSSTLTQTCLDTLELLPDPKEPTPLK